MSATIGELTSSTPVAVAAVVLLLSAVGLLARWLAASLWRALRAGLTRQGERLGALEDKVAELRADARIEGVRRFQLEATLLRAGFPLPPWPDSPDVDRDFLDRGGIPDDFLDRGIPDDTRAAPSIPPLPEFPRHRRSS